MDKKDEKQMMNFKDVYIGINGRGKTKKILDLKSKIEGQEGDKIIFNMNLEETAEKNNLSPSQSVFDKSYWNKFIESLLKLVIFEKEIKLDSLNDEEKGEINKMFKTAKAFFNKNSLDLKDQITSKIFKEDSKTTTSLSFSMIDDIKDIEPIRFNLNFLKDDIKNNLHNILKKSLSEERGSGNYHYLAIKFITEFIESGLVSEETLKKTYVLIDEPEIYLHPSLKRRVAKMLLKISQKCNIAISTHSQTIASLLIYNPDVNIYVAKENDKFNEVEISKRGRSIGEEPRISFIKNMFADKVIIVEGNNDLDLVEHIISKKEIELGINCNINYNIHIAPNKSSIANTYETLTNDYSIDSDDILVVYDKDGNENKECKDHVKWNESISNLNLKHEFYFELNLESDLDTDKSKLEEARTNGRLNNFFDDFKDDDKFKELESKIEDLLHIEVEQQQDEDEASEE